MSRKDAFAINKEPKKKIRIALAFNGIGEWSAFGCHSDTELSAIYGAVDTLEEITSASELSPEFCWVEVELPSPIVLRGTVIND